MCVSIVPAFASDWDLPGITIISRADRGADESIRYSSTSYQDRKKQQAEKLEKHVIDFLIELSQ